VICKTITFKHVEHSSDARIIGLLTYFNFECGFSKTAFKIALLFAIGKVAKSHAIWLVLTVEETFSLKYFCVRSILRKMFLQQLKLVKLHVKANIHIMVRS